MTRDQAIHSFLNSFSIPGYPATAVPDDVAFPYLTYTVGGGAFGDSYESTVHLYYHTASESAPNAKAEEICAELIKGGRQVLYEGGAVWIKCSTPAWFSVADQTDKNIKHRIINIRFDF